MTIKLIAVDMDGTFLNSEMKFDNERFLKQYEKMKEFGIRFVVASSSRNAQACRVWICYGKWKR